MRSVPCRCLLVGALLLMATAPASAQPTWNTLPGEFAFRTLKGFYVGALSGGGLSTEPTIVTGATKAGSWEKFRINVMDPPAPHDKAIQTSSRNYVTAVSGGGRNSDVMHTDATQTRAWEQFRIYDLRAGGVAPTYFALQTLNNHYVTAVGQGGKYEDAIHTDATSIGSWEYFRIVKCGDLGTDTEYTILSPNDQAFTAVEGGGIAETGQDPLVMGYWPGDTTRPCLGQVQVHSPERRHLCAADRQRRQLSHGASGRRACAEIFPARLRSLRSLHRQLLQNLSHRRNTSAGLGEVQVH